MKALHHRMSEELDDGCGRHRIDDIARHRYPADQELRDPSAEEGGDTADNKRGGDGLFEPHLEDTPEADDHDDLDGYENEVIAGRQLRHDEGGQGACDGGHMDDPAAFSFNGIVHTVIY